MSRLHTFVRWSIKRGYLNRDPYDDYVIGTAIYGTPFYLTKEERNQLYQAKFPDNPGLEVQRDIFIFQSFIGCRVGDLMKMTKNNVINGAIEYVPRKTKEGRPYTVYRSESLDGEFLPYQIHIAATPPENVIDLPADDSDSAFYRVAVEDN